jgi:site-specific DNA-methyltransferase (cytosine-N4-specific)
MFEGRCEDILATPPVIKLKGKTRLIFTSPPFPLNRKKRYGNLQGEQYVAWLSSLGPLLRDYLAPQGSIVIELGNAWIPGSPTMSTLPTKALLGFLEAGSLHLCEEFVCFNPARLPSPAEWVTVRRERVKDAFTRAWWMAPTEHPKANNRRVLTPYSNSMCRKCRATPYCPRRPLVNTAGGWGGRAEWGLRPCLTAKAVSM